MKGEREWERNIKSKSFFVRDWETNKARVMNSCGMGNFVVKNEN